MKKNIWMMAGILCGAVMEMCLFLLSEHMFQPLSYPFHPAVLWLLGIVSGIVLNNTCRQYDQADGFVSRQPFFTRWLRNALFSGLLIMFGVSLRYELMENYNAVLLNVNGSRTFLMMLMILIGCAAVMYGRNYAHTRGRRARIRALKKDTSRYGRRYTLLVTESRKAEDDVHVEIEGFVHGTIRKGDVVNVEYPGKQMEKHRVLAVHIGESSSLKAADNDVKIVLDACYDEKNPLAKYTVVSDLYEIHERKDLNQMESPLLEGVIADYARYARDPSYQGILVYGLMYGEFLVPGKLVHGHRIGDMMDPLQVSSDVGFPSLSSRQNPDLKILPVFTDWDALARWPEMMKDPDAVTVAVDFPAVVELMRKGFDGFVINPFGPQAFYVSDAFASSVMRMPGYREEMMQRKESREQ